MQPSNQHQNDNITFSNVQVSDYKIAQNPAAFQILSSGLYSNKIEAVIRELSCNAWDAHVSAGKRKTPIHVTLPTVSDRWFIVRDEGTGLDHEEVRKLYTTYFESDKRESNKTVGGFGLGAKSPFAYTDSFTVTSWKDGIERVYTCTMPLGEEPKLIRLLEQPTTHENGVEVKVPVKAADIEVFHDIAAMVFFFFPVKPQANMDIDLISFNEIKKTPLYALGFHEVKDSARQGRPWGAFNSLRMLRTNTKVVMGTVCYPLNLNSLNLTATELNFLSSMKFVLNMPIGSINVAASREELQYDPQSRTTLERTLRNMIRDLFDDVYTSWTKAQTDWEKRYNNMQWLRNVYLRTLGYHFNEDSVMTAKQSTLRPMILEYAAQYKREDSFVYAFEKNYLDIPSSYSSDSDIRLYMHIEGEVGRKEIVDGRVAFGNRHTRSAGLAIKEYSCVVHVDAEGMNEALKAWREKRGLPSVILVVPSKKNKRTEAKAIAQSLRDSLEGVALKSLSEIAAEANWKNDQKTVTKSQFVEIEEREVEVKYFNGSTKTMVFKDVPQTCKFVLMRNTRAKVNDSEHVYSFEMYKSVFVDNNDVSISGLSTKQTIDFFESLYTYAKEQGVDWNGPEGYIMLNPVEYQRLKMDNTNYPFIFAATMQSVMNNTVLLEHTKHAWDDLRMSSGYYSPTQSVWKVLHTKWNTDWSDIEKQKVRSAWEESAWKQWFEDALAPQTPAHLKWTSLLMSFKRSCSAIGQPFEMPYKEHHACNTEWQARTFAGHSIDWSKFTSVDEFTTMLHFVLENTTTKPSF